MTPDDEMWHSDTILLRELESDLAYLHDRLRQELDKVEAAKTEIVLLNDRVTYLRARLAAPRRIDPALDHPMGPGLA